MNGDAEDDDHKDNDQAAANGGPPSQAMQVGNAHGKHKIGGAKDNDPVGQLHGILCVQVMRSLQVKHLPQQPTLT